MAGIVHLSTAVPTIVTVGPSGNSSCRETSGQLNREA